MVFSSKKGGKRKQPQRGLCWENSVRLTSPGTAGTLRSWHFFTSPPPRARATQRFPVLIGPTSFPHSQLGVLSESRGHGLFISIYLNQFYLQGRNSLPFLPPHLCAHVRTHTPVGFVSGLYALLSCMVCRITTENLLCGVTQERNRGKDFRLLTLCSIWSYFTRWHPVSLAEPPAYPEVWLLQSPYHGIILDLYMQYG